jgi:hypothetical protein
VFWSLTAGYFANLHLGYPWSEYFAVGLGATTLLFGSVLIHELSNAIVANALGQPVRRISLFIFGGMAHMNTEPAPRAPGCGCGTADQPGTGALFWLVPRVFALPLYFPMWASVFEYHQPRAGDLQSFAGLPA